MQRSEWLHRLSGILGLIIFGVAIYFIHRIAKRYSLHQIVEALQSLPPKAILLSFAAAFGSYYILSMYDYLAVRYLGKPMPAYKTAFISFIAFSFTNNIGMANLAGNTVRLRMYSHFKLKPMEILTVIVFISFSFWTGFLGLIGGLFLFTPPEIPGNIALSPDWLRVLGAILFLVPIVYFLVCYFQWAPRWLKKLRFDLPSWRLALLQIMVSALEWALAAVALYVLLPAQSTEGVLDFLSVFGMAQFVSLLSHVPGGLGVLEATVLYFVSPDEQPAAMALGALLAFRIIYYFVPLILSVVGFLLFEVLKTPSKLQPE